MKNLKFKMLGGILLVVALATGFLSSCSDDDKGASGGALAITSVSKTAVYPANGDVPETVVDSLTTVGFAGQSFIIRGSGFTGIEKIYFNDFDTYFNPTLVSDTIIFVTINRDTPYADVSNKIRIVKGDAEATFDFTVAPPAPEMKSFQPVNAADGEQITIYGTFFLNPTVTVGGAPAAIVSNTLTQIVAILPTGSQNKFVKVATISGVSEWHTAVGTAIFDDAFYAPFTFEPWNNHEYVTDEAKAYQGTTFIKKAINGWDNIQGNWAWYDQLSGYTGIHFSLRSDDPGKLVWIVNGNGWGMDSHAVITTDKWKEVRLTWAELGNPAALQNLSFQEFTGSAHNYYFDNIGYTLD